MKHSVKIPDAVIRRLPRYLRYCERCINDGTAFIRSSDLAGEFGTTSSLVRNDLAYFGDFGNQGIGYPAKELKRALYSVLGIGEFRKAIVVGMGSVGRVMLDYLTHGHSFIRPVALFDVDKGRVGISMGGMRILDAAQLENYLRENPVDICIISSPDELALETAEKAAACGVEAILNMTNVDIPPQHGVFIETLQIYDSMLRLNYYLRSHI